MVLVVAVHEVLQYGAALKEPDGRSISQGISQGRNPSIGVDLKKPVLLPEASQLSVFGQRVVRPPKLTFWVFLASLMEVVYPGRQHTSAELIKHRPRTLYSRPSSSRRMDTLMPFGVWAVYR